MPADPSSDLAHVPAHEAWSCDDLDSRGACCNPHGCHCREITALRNSRDEITAERDAAREERDEARTQIEDIDAGFSQALRERDEHSDALLHASEALDGPEWGHCTLPQPAGQTGDLNLDVPVLAAEVMARATVAEARAATLARENKRLKAALKPFARTAGQFEHYGAEHEPFRGGFSVGDLRAAAAVLASPESPAGQQEKPHA